MKVKARKRAPSLRKLREKLWSLTSRYVRLSHSDGTWCACVTCGTRKPWQELHAGHFVPQARGNAVRYDLRNIAPQCFRCNISLGGNPSAYAVYMLDTYGESVVRELETKAHGSVKYTRADYETMIDDMSERLADLAMGRVREGAGAKFWRERIG